MPANEFEKQVQQKMEELQLSPSASVWEKVEAQIREKKRRRIIFFFILPLAIGLLGFSFYKFLYTAKKTEQVQQTAAVKKDNSLATDLDKNLTETKNQPSNTQSPELNEITQPIKDNTTQPVKSNTIQSVKNNKIQPVKNDVTQKQEPAPRLDKNAGISITNHPDAIIKNNVAVKSRSKVNDHHQQQDISPVTATNVIPTQRINNDIDRPATTTTIKDNKTPDTEKITQPAGATMQQKDSGSVKKDSLNKKDFAATDKKEEVVLKKKTGSSKMKWGIDFSLGILSNHNNVFSLEKSYAADMYVGSPTGPTGSATVTPPSLIRSGPAFRIGLVGEWQVSKRSRISTGLQYIYASNRIKIGEATDTTLRVQASINYSPVQVNRVYRGALQNNYTNGYHFISIPLGYHWQINKGKKMPIEWNLGISASYLVATNALIYDRSYGGIYYHDKNVFTKFHFDLGTGLSFRIKAKNGLEWVAGPELSFDMRRLIKNDNKQYLLFGGINTRLLFPKKKNK